MKLPTEALPQIYTSLMEQIKSRLEVVSTELLAASKKSFEFEGVAKAESACLQIRKVTELLALAVVVAHNEYEPFQSGKFIKQWNADAIFTSLAKLNDGSFPVRFVIDGVTEDGFANAVIEEDGYLTRERLCKIYNDCGSLLHIGKLHDLVHKPKQIDLGEVQLWRKEIMLLLNNHFVFLPSRSKIMYVSMAKAPDGHVDCRLEDVEEYETVFEAPHRIRRYRTRP